MNKLVLFLITLVIVFINPTLGKEGAGGHGGGAFVCKSSKGEILKLELLDFYEAENEWGMVINQHKGLDAKQILSIYQDRISSIDKYLSFILKPYFENLDKKIKFVNSDLEVVNDSFYRIKPSANWCDGGTISYQQIANYTNYGTILINEQLFKHQQFVEVLKAGLYLHEVVYEYLRTKAKDKDSQRARHMVGVIASTLEINSARDEINSIRDEYLFPADFAKILKNNLVFYMGSPLNERTRHNSEDMVRVDLTKNFEIMKTEVTQLLYFSITGKNPSLYSYKRYCPDSHKVINGVSLCPNLPVESISYNDIVNNFLVELNALTGKNYRLPTEAEWEYAAKNGSWGGVDIASPLGAEKYMHMMAWFKDNSNSGPHEVGMKNSTTDNELYDIRGNVSEFVQDMWQDTLPGGVDPLVIEGNRPVIRGGNFSSDVSDLRLAKRMHLSGKNSGWFNVGFRLVREL